MATINTIHSGTVANADWSADTEDVTISVSDVSDCVLFFSGGGSTNDTDAPDSVQVTGTIISTTVLRFRFGEGDSAEGADLEWCILEFDSGNVTTQQGTTALGTNTTISAVTLDDTILLMTGCFDDNSANFVNTNNAHIELTGTTTITTSSGSSGDQYTWQTVSYDTGADISCQHGSVTFGASTTATDAISAVTLANSLLFINGLSGGATSVLNERSTAYGDFSSTTEIRATRSETTGTPVFGYCVADFGDGASAQTGLMTTFTAGTETATITSVDTSRAVICSTFNNNSMTNAHDDSAAEAQNRCNVTVQFNSGTEIQADEIFSTGNKSFQWQVCEWPAAVGGPAAAVFGHNQFHNTLN